MQSACTISATAFQDRQRSACQSCQDASRNLNHEKIMNDDFSGWTKADFARWLHENYPKPLNLLEDTSWIVELRIHHSSKKKDIFELTARGDYETCMNDLAKELAFYAHAGLLAKERWEIFIHPAPRK
jgi:hypothetical protein